MSQHAFSTMALAAALAFLAMALSACASSEQAIVQTGPVEIAAVEPPAGLPEFHGAHIGGDALRSRLPTE